MTYEYDVYEIKCLLHDGDYRPVEPHCLKCGYKPDECGCVMFSPATYWDEEGERWVTPEKAINKQPEKAINKQPRIRCRPPVGPICPKYEEKKYNTFTFPWSTVEDLLHHKNENTKTRFRRWKQRCELYEGEYRIELDYRQLEPVGIWMYWEIRPCDNYSWVKICVKSGSPMEMEWCESLPEDQEIEEDGFEDCEDCGYTHHYEDKCPVGNQCRMYERWREEEQEEE